MIPVKVSSSENPQEQQSACTLDVAGRGARISGVKLAIKSGDVVIVERGKARVRFEVAWIGEPGTSKYGQIGVKSLEPILGLWGVKTARPDDGGGIDPETIVPPLPPRSAVSSAPAAAPSLAAVRYTCRGEVEFRKEAQYSQPAKGKLRDIGARGCFVLTRDKLPLNTRVVLDLKIGELELQVRGAVKTAEALGMWLEWLDLPEAQRNQLNELMERLAG